MLYNRGGSSNCQLSAHIPIHKWRYNWNNTYTHLYKYVSNALQCPIHGMSVGGQKPRRMTGWRTRQILCESKCNCKPHLGAHPVQRDEALTPKAGLVQGFVPLPEHARGFTGDRSSRDVLDNDRQRDVRLAQSTAPTRFLTTPKGSSL